MKHAGNTARALAAGISCLVIAMGVGRFAYTPLLPAMQQSLGFGNELAGFIASANYLGYFLGALAVAAIPAAFDKRLLLRALLVASIVTTAAMAWTDSPPAWMLLRLAAGLVSAGIFVLAGSMVLQALPPTRREALTGIHFSGVGIGIAGSGLLLAVAGPLLSLGWRGGWTAVALLCAALLPLCWSVPPPHRGDDAPAAGTRAAAGMAFPMGLLALAYFCEGLGYIVSGTFLVSIVKAMPGLEGFGEYAWVAVGLAGAPSALMWSAIARRTGLAPALIAAYAVQAVGIVLPVLSGSHAAALLAAVMFGGTFIGITVLVVGIANRAVPDHPSRVLGLLTAAFGLGQVLGPIIAGFIAGGGRGFDVPLLAAGATVAVGAVLLVMAALKSR